MQPPIADAAIDVEVASSGTRQRSIGVAAREAARAAKRALIAPLASVDDAVATVRALRNVDGVARLRAQQLSADETVCATCVAVKIDGVADLAGLDGLVPADRALGDVEAAARCCAAEDSAAESLRDAGLADEVVAIADLRAERPAVATPLVWTSASRCAARSCKCEDQARCRAMCPQGCLGLDLVWIRVRAHAEPAYAIRPQGVHR